MNPEPLVSVIIPTYKRASLVIRAIESVRRQTYRNLEILVVDDASPDETETVVRAIPEARLTYMRHERNQGSSAVRNTGIRAATGEYIALLDDDDAWREDKLEKQLPLLLLMHHDVVLCGALRNGRPRIWNGENVTLDDLRQGNAFDPSGLVARAEVLKTTPFDSKLRIGEDWDVFIRIAQKYSIGYVREPLIIYDDGTHDRVTNEARSQSVAELETRAAVLCKHRDFLGDRWFKYHMAESLLSYLASKKNRVATLAYAVKRCGISAVTAVLINKITWYLRQRTPKWS